ncbi:MAG: hypothetical protein WBX15_19265 [Thermoanaerobaculia bacterium]
MKQILDTLIDRLIDYAGIFPPAKLPMDQAVRNYANYARGGCAPALGRFVVPVARLGEFESAARGLHKPEEAAWPIAVLTGPKLDDDVSAIAEWNVRFAGRAVIDTIEAKVTDGREIELIARLVSPAQTAYLEVLLQNDLEKTIDALAKAGVRAKVRTGGVTEEVFPSALQLAEFVTLCAAKNVPFKATAGLHHPLRCTKPLTYEPGSRSATMHGFVNLFVAAALARKGMTVDEAEALLEERDPGAFRIEESSLSWRDHTLQNDELAASRNEFAISFGSCSFDEPMNEIRQLWDGEA